MKLFLGYNLYYYTSKQNIKMSQQLITKKNIIFVIEGEFDITRMSELPDHIVHHCISFLAAEEELYYPERNAPPVVDQEWLNKLKDFRQNRPSKWFDKLLRSETERLWNTKYVPELTKAFNKIPVARLQKLTEFSYCFGMFYKKGNRKSDWIQSILNFENFNVNYRTQCIETILLSKGLSYPNENNPECFIEPYNPENFVCKI